MQSRIECIIRGKVQGVFYRQTVQEEALKRSIAGSAENLPDGSVKVVAKGEKKSLEKFLEILKKGSPDSAVENIDVEWQKISKNLKGFKIL